LAGRTWPYQATAAFTSGLWGAKRRISIPPRQNPVTPIRPDRAAGCRLAEAIRASKSPMTRLWGIGSTTFRTDFDVGQIREAPFACIRLKGYSQEGCPGKAPRQRSPEMSKVETPQSGFEEDVGFDLVGENKSLCLSYCSVLALQVGDGAGIQGS
jgi:hypothetical protein